MMPTETLAECPLCDGTSVHALPTPGHWIGGECFSDLTLGLRKCRCGMIFASPRPTVELLNAFYSGNGYSCHSLEGSASSGAAARHLLDAVEGRLPAGVGKSLLDYGAGSGALLLAAHGWEKFAFEPGQKGLESCRMNGLEATDDVMAIPRNRFGLITLHHVLEHIPNPLEVLEGLHAFSVPNGLLYIGVPNAHAMRARLALPFLSRRFNVDERYRAFPLHLHYYTRQTLARMLARSGWKVVHASTMGIGLDQFFAAKEGEQPDMAKPSRRPEPAKPRLRRVLRDLFLDHGFGENLAVIATST